MRTLRTFAYRPCDRRSNTELMRNRSGHIVGVDGGGTACRVAIADSDGATIATATGPAANPATSLKRALEAVGSTLEAAAGRAGLDAGWERAARAHLGLAGVINRPIADAVARALRFGAVRVTDDRPTVMAGALAGADGFVAAIGTGSFIGRQTGGAQTFAGGWGLRLGDQASGAWLGQRALSGVLEWRDGLRPGSDLLAQLLRRFDGDPGEIVMFAARAGPGDFAALAPVVLDAAEAGDANGTDLLAEGADYLRSALGVLGHRPGDPLCLTGGLGPAYATFLGAEFTGNLVAPKGSALDGAVALARSLSAPERE